MSEKPQTRPNIEAFAQHIKKSLTGIDFIGRDGKPYERDYEEDARWFTSIQMASEMRETYRTKDWAHYVEEGMQPLDDNELREWFCVKDEESGDPIGEPQWPEGMVIRRFFHG